MEFHNYGVTLRRLTEDKIELVRRWRNDPKIQQYMEYREYITEEMQRAWFHRIDNDHNFYFIIEYEGKEIGLINIRDVDYDLKTGEPGIFIWDDEYLNTEVPMRASFCLGDFVWDTLKLDSQHIHVLKSNKRAINVNKFFGYQLKSGQDNVENQEYILTRERMMELLPKTEKLKKVLMKRSDESNDKII